MATARAPAPAPSATKRHITVMPNDGRLDLSQSALVVVDTTSSAAALAALCHAVRIQPSPWPSSSLPPLMMRIIITITIIIAVIESWPSTS
jgi:hypothetical protein